DVCWIAMVLWALVWLGRRHPYLASVAFGTALAFKAFAALALPLFALAVFLYWGGALPRTCPVAGAERGRATGPAGDHHAAVLCPEPEGVPDGHGSLQHRHHQWWLLHFRVRLLRAPARAS